MSAEAVWAVRRGLRMEFSRPSLPGSLSNRASGRPITLQLLSLAEHRELIEAARSFAEEVYETDPELVRNRGIALLAAPFSDTERVEYLDKA